MRVLNLVVVVVLVVHAPNSACPCQHTLVQQIRSLTAATRHHAIPGFILTAFILYQLQSCRLTVSACVCVGDHLCVLACNCLHNRVLVMDKGRALEYGRPAELLENDQGAFTGE